MKWKALVMNGKPPIAFLQDDAVRRPVKRFEQMLGISCGKKKKEELPRGGGSKYPCLMSETCRYRRIRGRWKREGEERRAEGRIGCGRGQVLQMVVAIKVQTFLKPKASSS